MSDDQKLIALLVKMDSLETRFDSLEDRIATKPCPSPMCQQCQERIADIEQYKAKREAEIVTEEACRKDVLARLDVVEEWKTKRMVELDDDAKDETTKSTRDSWIWPTLVSACLALLGFYLGMNA
jgi:hypothetical protein